MTASPFQQILGPSFDALPEPVRRLHSLTAPTAVAGLADIEVAPGLIPSLICWLAGLPKSGTGVPVSAAFTPDGRGGEHWVRRFGERRYASSFSAVRRGDENLLGERFGPFSLEFRLQASRTGLSWLLVDVTCVGIRAPRWAVPKVGCLERGEGGRFAFDIKAALPFVGPLIHYIGWLA